MPADLYDYAVIRVVPRVEREEFINAGILLSSQPAQWLRAEIALDETRLALLDPDIDLVAVRRHLVALTKICAGNPAAGPIAQLPLRARFHWLTAKRSSIIQTSPVHTGKSSDLNATLGHLMHTLVCTPKPRKRPGHRAT
ncbi:MAG: DUF3037 domain-containing protein [Pseudomonadota bacterium]|nr:DUF3037 domain-containing protein [Pseudomonadota bacterium]